MDESSPSELRLEALELLLPELPAPQARELLEALLRSPTSALRIAAIRAFGDREREDLPDHLLHLAETNNHEPTQRALAELFRRRGGRRARGGLARLLSSLWRGVATEALRALGEIGTKETISLLEERLEDLSWVDFERRRETVAAIDRIRERYFERQGAQDGKLSVLDPRAQALALSLADEDGSLSLEERGAPIEEDPLPEEDS